MWFNPNHDISLLTSENSTLCLKFHNNLKIFVSYIIENFFTSLKLYFPLLFNNDFFQVEEKEFLYLISLINNSCYNINIISKTIFSYLNIKNDKFNIKIFSEIIFLFSLSLIIVIIFSFYVWFLKG